MITDVRKLRGQNSDSDHYLVTVKIRQRTRKVNEGVYRRSTNWDVTKLQNLSIKEYEKNIAQKLKEIDPSPDIELEWDNLENVINDVADDEVGIRINTKNAGWFDEDCRKPIKAKNEVRKKYVTRDTRTNREEYIKREK
jgi:hypothetical protein